MNESPLKAGLALLLSTFDPMYERFSAMRLKNGKNKPHSTDDTRDLGKCRMAGP